MRHEKEKLPCEKGCIVAPKLFETRLSHMYEWTITVTALQAPKNPWGTEKAERRWILQTTPSSRPSSDKPKTKPSTVLALHRRIRT